jgi:hypothetical protein
MNLGRSLRIHRRWLNSCIEDRSDKGGNREDPLVEQVKQTPLDAKKEILEKALKMLPRPERRTNSFAMSWVALPRWQASRCCRSGG